MRKYGESKTTQIMMAIVPHATSGLGLRKFQADEFLLTQVYKAYQNTFKYHRQNLLCCNNEGAFTWLTSVAKHHLMTCHQNSMKIKCWP